MKRRLLLAAGAILLAANAGCSRAQPPASGKTEPAAVAHHVSEDSLNRITLTEKAERDVLTPAERVGVAQTRADVAKAKLEAERLIESARLDVEAAQIAYDRAVPLLRNRAGSQRTVDEAETRLKLAQETLKTAEIRNEFLQSVSLDAQAGELAERTVASPVSGVLQDIQAAVGETVTAGETLFAVVRTDPVWMRVPIYVGRLREVDTT